MATLIGHEGTVVSVHARPVTHALAYGIDAEKLVATSSEDMTVKVWDMRTNSNIMTLTDPSFDSETMGPVRIHPFKDELTVASDDKLLKFDLRNGSSTINSASNSFHVDEVINNQFNIKNKSKNIEDLGSERAINCFQYVPQNPHLMYLPLDSGETLLIDTTSSFETPRILFKFHMHGNVADTTTLLYHPDSIQWNDNIQKNDSMEFPIPVSTLMKTTSGPFSRLDLFSGGCDSKVLRMDAKSGKMLSNFEMQKILPKVSNRVTTAGDVSSLNSKQSNTTTANPIQMCNPPFVWSLSASLAQSTVAAALGDGSIMLLPIDNIGRVDVNHQTVVQGEFCSSVSCLTWLGRAPVASKRDATSSENERKNYATEDSRFLIAAGSNQTIIVWERQNIYADNTENNDEDEQTETTGKSRADKKREKKAAKKAAGKQNVLIGPAVGVEAKDLEVAAKFALDDEDVPNDLCALGWDRFLLADTSNIVKLFDLGYLSQ